MQSLQQKEKNRGLEDVDERELRLCGGIGSPYSNKVLMYLKFRRIPHRWIMMHSPEERGLANSRGPVLLPKIVWPDGSVMNDSTFLIQRLEREYHGRAAIPSSPGLAFLSSVIEDFADEFLTKWYVNSPSPLVLTHTHTHTHLHSMYHFRWTKDPLCASENIILQQLGGPHAPHDVVEKMGKQVRERQVSRLAIVGSNSTTGRSIEMFYKKFMKLMENHLKSGFPFLFGSRPSAADFAILGQLHPMIALDPETSHISRKHSGRVCAWYHYSTDLSGLSVLNENKGWISENNKTGLPQSLRDIFTEILGKFYVPFMIANDEAYRAKKKTFECYLDEGRVKWTQPTFRYQSKCVRWLREDFEKLPNDSKRFVRRVLSGTGVLRLFDASSSTESSRL